jgi:hypothetical protein
MAQADATIHNMKKMTVTKKYVIETKISLFVSIKKSAEASMIAIAVSNDFLLHQSMHMKSNPNRTMIAPPMKNPVCFSPAASVYKPARAIAAPPPKNVSKIMMQAHMARHLAQLLMSHMYVIETMIPVTKMQSIVFQVFAMSVSAVPASLSINLAFNSSNQALSNGTQ